jgi:hypothetical protein
LLDKPDVKVAFFGDDILEDVAANYEFDNSLRQRGSPVRWDTITTLAAATDGPEGESDHKKKPKKKSAKKDSKGSGSKDDKPGKLRKDSSKKDEVAPVD